MNAARYAAWRALSAQTLRSSRPTRPCRSLCIPRPLVVAATGSGPPATTPLAGGTEAAVRSARIARRRQCSVKT